MHQVTPSQRAPIVRPRRQQPASKRPLWSFREGWNAFRWQADAAGRWYEEVPHHFGVGPFERGLVCRAYANRTCYLCELITPLQQRTALRDRQLAQRLQPVLRIFLNVLDLQRPDDGVKVLGISPALLDEIRMSL
jgi:hypothetical protein